MNASVMIKVDNDLKKRFSATAKAQGASMTFLLKNFMEAYADNPNSVNVVIDESVLDAAWQTEAVGRKMQELSQTLKDA